VKRSARLLSVSVLDAVGSVGMFMKKDVVVDISMVQVVNVPCRRGRG
jgi:hypothetical protein